MTTNALRLTALSLFASLLLAPAALAAPDPLSIGFLGRTAAGGEATAEIAAFDAKTKRVFATDAENNQLDVFDFSKPAAPLSLAPIDLSPYGAGPNSVVDLPNFGAVAVAVKAAKVGDPGNVVVFDAKKGTHLATYPAGPLPDMVTTAKDDRYILVANEGEPADDGSVDPEGSVTVIDLRRGLKKADVDTADFHGVPLKGPVRVFTPGATVEQDLEPEYITSHGDWAWVSIQEANAVGVLDIEEAEFAFVRSLGFKNHGLLENAFDATDTGATPNIEPHPDVYGMYQPDAISAFTVKVRVPRRWPGEWDWFDGDYGSSKFRYVTRTLIATANEGDARDWDFFAEESRVSGLKLAPEVFPAGASANSQLGRLNVTKTLGNTDADPEYEQLYAFGGRSMSLLSPNGRIVYDSGDQLEQLSKSFDPGNFNKDNAPSGIDNRSDNKGPEPEAVTTGTVGGHTYAFLGAERSGMIYAFDLSSSPGEAELAGWVNTRDADRGPEGIELVPASKSPTGKAMLLVTYEITGTVAAYSVSD
jgi:choice-of-anchor I-like protein